MEFYWKKIKRLEKEKENMLETLSQQQSLNDRLISQLEKEIEKTEYFQKELNDTKKLVIQAANILTEKEKDYNRTIEFMKLTNIGK